MRAAEILRQLADIVDAAQKDNNASPNQAKLTKIDSNLPGEHEPTPQNCNVMIPPLQAKLELLKKATGVESDYDKEDDELDQMKHLSGIGPTLFHVASEDNDITG